jgi:hypothetical protein
MFRDRQPSRVWGTLALALLSAGCGSSTIVPARGKVVFPDGTPLKGGMVTTQPVGGPSKVSARGQIRPDGTFQLGTFTDDDGVEVGEHRVLIVPPEASTVNERNPPRPTIDRRFRRFESSGLTITVTRDPARNVFTLTVQKPGAR